MQTIAFYLIVSNCLLLFTFKRMIVINVGMMMDLLVLTGRLCVGVAVRTTQNLVVTYDQLGRSIKQTYCSPRICVRVRTSLVAMPEISPVCYK